MDRTLLGTLLLCFFFTIRHLLKHIMCMMLSCDPTQATCFAHVAEISKATHFTQSPPLSKVYAFAVSLYSYQPSSYDKRVTSQHLSSHRKTIFLYCLSTLLLPFYPLSSDQLITKLYSRFAKPGRHFLVETDDSKEDKQDRLDGDDSE